MKAVDKIADFLVSVVLIVFLVFLLLMYLSGNMTFEQGVYDKREDRPKMEEVDALLTELTNGISSEKDEFIVKNTGVVYKRYRYENLSDKEKLYLKNRMDSLSKWKQYDYKINRYGESFYYCYKQFELIFTKGIDANNNDKYIVDDSWAASVGWRDDNSVCRDNFLKSQESKRA